MREYAHELDFGQRADSRARGDIEVVRIYRLTNVRREGEESCEMPVVSSVTGQWLWPFFLDAAGGEETSLVGTDQSTEPVISYIL